jgi:hypothetical protein
MTRDDIATRRLVLRLLSREALEATEAGRVGEAASLLDLKLPADWTDIALLARKLGAGKIGVQIDEKGRVGRRVAAGLIPSPMGRRRGPRVSVGG